MDGPVRNPKLFNGQNKLFFMANYEAFRRRQNFQSTYSVPTAAMFAGNFSGVNATIYDPTTKQPFPGNIIRTTRSTWAPIPGLLRPPSSTRRASDSLDSLIPLGPFSPLTPTSSARLAFR